MKTLYNGIAALCIGLFLASCSTTPQVRIEENPQVFQSLSAQEQQLVAAGQISTGMSPQAVFLAWGYPNNTPVQGESKGKHFMKWIYTTTQSYTTQTAWTGPYWGYGGWYDPYYSRLDTRFIETPVAEVTFENNKVVNWQSR